MSSKCQCNQWKNARVTLLQTFKKRKQDFSSLSNLVQPLPDNNKANTSNTNISKGEWKIWFWHESVNKSHFNFEEERYSDIDI